MASRPEKKRRIENQLATKGEGCEIPANAMINKCMKIYDLLYVNAHSIGVSSHMIDFMTIDVSNTEIKLSCEFRLNILRQLKQYVSSCLQHFKFESGIAQKSDNLTRRVDKNETSLKLSANLKIQSGTLIVGEIYQMVRICYGIGRCISDANLKLNTLMQLVRKINDKASSKVPKVVLIMVMEYLGP